jgi:hypothetical protein
MAEHLPSVAQEKGARFSADLFPLSLGEREKLVTVLEILKASGLADSRATLLPLLGERAGVRGTAVPERLAPAL